MFTLFRNRIVQDTQIHGFESFYMILEANDVLCVHGCERIEEYSEKSIELICLDRILKIQGFDLDLLIMREKEVRIGGRIGSIYIVSRKESENNLTDTRREFRK